MNKKDLNDAIAGEMAKLQKMQKDINDLQLEINKITTAGIKSEGKIEFFKEELVKLEEVK